MSLTECDLIFTGLHGPYVCHSPRSDDLDIRRKCFDTKFETNLVITFTGCTMADSNSVFFTCNFNKFLGNCRTCHRGTKQIFMFVYSTCLYTRHYIIVTEIINNIFNI